MNSSFPLWLFILPRNDENATLTTSRLFGPLPLTAERIDLHLQASSPGVYALGEERDDVFVIRQMGRCDHDLRSTLKRHVGGRFSLFKFRYALSPLDAFGKECELFHSVVTLDDPVHPKPPEGTYVNCTRCQSSRAATAE